MVQICALASGSNGNCYYIGNDKDAVLIDAGISNRQLTKRMRDSGLQLSKVKALFISHEHIDHIKGMRSITDCNPIEGFATRKTYENARKDHRSAKVNYFSAGDTMHIGSITVHSFRKHHDAADPVSFRVETLGKNIAVITDLGYANQDVLEHLKQCDAAFIESNYEHAMLMNGNYPAYLKKRVASNYGHLSNQQAFELVSQLKHPALKTIFLSHISAQNNRVDLAINQFSPLLASHRIIPTSRHMPTEVVII